MKNELRFLVIQVRWGSRYPDGRYIAVLEGFPHQADALAWIDQQENPEHYGVMELWVRVKS